jgi:ABC-type branched-subunit amino acid transport system ATPase component
MFRIIRELGDSGMTVLLVEQSVEHALKIADHVTVLDNGRVASSGPPSDFYDLRALRGDYFGTRSSG